MNVLFRLIPGAGVPSILIYLEFFHCSCLLSFVFRQCFD